MPLGSRGPVVRGGRGIKKATQLPESLFWWEQRESNPRRWQAIVFPFTPSRFATAPRGMPMPSLTSSGISVLRFFETPFLRCAADAAWRRGAGGHGRVYEKKRLSFLNRFWWEQRESNPRPSACKADALNQLSYAPFSFLFVGYCVVFPLQSVITKR